MNFQHQIVKNCRDQIEFQIFSPGGRPHYYIGLWLAGSPNFFEHIERIEYRLHNTSRLPFRESSDRFNKFRVTFWTWSMYPIHIRIFDQSSIVDRCIHKLEYDLPPDTGTNYVQVGKIYDQEYKHVFAQRPHHLSRPNALRRHGLLGKFADQYTKYRPALP